MEGTLFALHLSAAEIEANIADVLSSPKNNGTLEMIVRRPAENSREVGDTGFLMAIGDSIRKQVGSI